jgi:hypothetical protein
LIPAVSVAGGLRDALSWDDGTLARGCMLLKSWQRRRLLRLLAEADSPGEPKESAVSLMGDLKDVADKIADAAEAGLKDVDGQALAEVRRLGDEAVAAETQAAALVTGYKSVLVETLAKLGPEVSAQILPDAEKLLGDVKALFGLV